MKKNEIKKQEYLLALTNQKRACLEVYDLSFGTLDDASRVWSYELPYYQISGTKRRHSSRFGDVALAVCGHHYGCMVSYPAGELLWQTEAAAESPHGIELLPNGVIAIASSVGGEVQFFTTESPYSDAPAATVSLRSAHGVLWDDQHNVLWALGGDVLAAYRITLHDGGRVTVEEDLSRRTTVPLGGAHDIAPVYGNTDEMWITAHMHVYRFHKPTKTFDTDYIGSEYLDRGGVKGVGNFGDGSLVFLYPDGIFKGWTTQGISLVRRIGDEMICERLVSETEHFYKARIWNPSYQ